MNKFTKLILTSAVFATSGFATTISGTENIKEGASYEVKNKDCTLTGTMTLAGSEADGNAAKLIIDADRTLDIQGGTLTYDEQGTYKPQITLNGTIKMSQNDKGANPTIKLNQVNIDGEKSFVVRTNLDETIYSFTRQKEIAGVNAIFGTNNGSESFFMNVDGILYSDQNVDLSSFIDADTTISQHKNWIKAETLYHIYYSLPITISDFPQFFDSYPASIANLSGYVISGNYSIIEEESDVKFDIEPYWDDLGNGWCKADIDYGTIYAKKNSYNEYNLKLLVTDNISQNISTARNAGIDFKTTIFRQKNNIDLISEITTLGNLDMSTLRTYAADTTKAEEPLDLSDKISGFNASVANVKLPFNCKFSNIDLSNVGSVEYTTLTVPAYNKITVKDNIIQKQNPGKQVFGHYAENPELGVTVSSDKVQTLNETKTVDSQSMNLSDLVVDENYNKTDLKIKTEDLDEKSYEAVVETKYNFGFQGTGSISITGDFKAIFAGDNSNYTPADNSLTLPSTVEFAGNSSLFPVTQTYGKGIFSGQFTNEIPAGKTATFTNGINLESNHTLNVNGKLIV